MIVIHTSFKTYVISFDLIFSARMSRNDLCYFCLWFFFCYSCYFDRIFFFFGFYYEYFTSKDFFAWKNHWFHQVFRSFFSFLLNKNFRILTILFRNVFWREKSALFSSTWESHRKNKSIFWENAKCFSLRSTKSTVSYCLFTIYYQFLSIFFFFNDAVNAVDLLKSMIENDITSFNRRVEINNEIDIHDEKYDLLIRRNFEKCLIDHVSCRDFSM